MAGEPVMLDSAPCLIHAIYALWQTSIASNSGKRYIKLILLRGPFERLLNPNDMATIYQIAKRAGVSPKTTARILSGGSPLSRHRANVLRHAKALGYVRNQQAANLRTGRSGLIGVIVPYIDNPFYTGFLQGLHDALLSHHYQSLIACSFGQAENMLTAIRVFETYNIDGLVLDISEGILTQEILKKLSGFPKRSRSVVITGGQRQDVLHDHLCLDNKRAMGKVVEYLFAKGHRGFGFLGGVPENLNIAQRLDGFKEALKYANVSFVPEWVSLGDPALQSVFERAKALLQKSPTPSALLCTSDVIAMIAMKAAAESGLRVPMDVAITGFDDIEQASFLTPSLTTLRQPMKAMTADIVQLLIARIKSIDLPVREKIYDVELIHRSSA